MKYNNKQQKQQIVNYTVWYHENHLKPKLEQFVRMKSCQVGFLVIKNKNLTSVSQGERESGDV